MNIGMIRGFKQKLKDDFVTGIFSKTSDPAFIEIMGRGGFDFVIIDLEHGPNNVRTVQNLLRAAEVTGIFPIVRVKEDNASLIGEVLDIGACGIQVPHVNNAVLAKEVIKLSRFAPLGMRGVCRFVRAADYSSVDRFRYFNEANEAIVVLQIEGLEGIENIDGFKSEICKIPRKPHSAGLYQIMSKADMKTKLQLPSPAWLPVIHLSYCPLL